MVILDVPHTELITTLIWFIIVKKMSMNINYNLYDDNQPLLENTLALYT